jgi:hypothetical protein
MTEKSSPGTRQTDGKNLVWFGETEKNYPNYQCLPLLTVLPLNYFMLTLYGGDPVYPGAWALVHLHHQLRVPVLPAPAGVRHHSLPHQDTRPQARLRQEQESVLVLGAGVHPRSSSRSSFAFCQQESVLILGAEVHSHSGSRSSS